MGDPFEEGKLAAADGKGLLDNPYPDGNEAAGAWEAGLSYVNDTDEDGEIREDA